jgi:hypothetical protein
MGLGCLNFDSRAVFPGLCLVGLTAHLLVLFAERHQKGGQLGGLQLL